MDKRTSRTRKKADTDQNLGQEPGSAAVENLAEEAASVHSSPPFPIITIGASAGGLEALEVFLNHVSPSSGMAYVIIQHLDPTRKGMLVDLLQRATPMPVIQVSDRLTLVPDAVHVIPPNKDMSILHGVLHLFPPSKPRGLRLPIDYFMRSLADDQQGRSVGVILSGMGSDGTLGLRAIKEKGGAVFVQDPTSAKFDSMPRSVIDAGLADVVAPVEELPARISAYLHHIPILARPRKTQEIKTQSALEKILILLRSQTGTDFSHYKKTTIYRRIERRMGLHQITRIASYVRFLQENPQETELLFKELLIGVTSFFRDPAAWEQLKNVVIPAMLDAYPKGGSLRAWVTGCSTGEEAYSLAMVFKEVFAQVRQVGNYSLQIFATDLDSDAIDKARQGFYPANIVADVSSERLQRFFVEQEHGYQVGKEIREMVVFAQQNLLMDAPFTKLNLLICRNLLIYFEAELQKKLLPLFHYSLIPGGILFLGSSETIGGFSDLFNTLPGKQRLFRKLETTRHVAPADFPATFFPVVPVGHNAAKYPVDELQQPVSNLSTLVDQLILKRFAPGAVLTNDKGDILYFSGRTGKYLEPAAGKANLNIFAMAREGLRYELNNAFHKAARQKSPVILKNLSVGTNGGTQVIDLTIEPLSEPTGLRGMLLVIFSDMPTPPESARPGKSRKKSSTNLIISQLNEDLLRANEELQSTREEMQTSQEELKSSNEELQSTNEELQSTNEELTTSKEEMQSLNEELQTVNHELQARLDDLLQTNSDLKNFLESTSIATLFLDENLRVRRFTNQASKIIKLIPGDIGRLVTDIASDLLYPEMIQDVQEVQRSLVFKEKPVATREGNWFTVRIMPYRTLDNRIDGVVITFADISVAKKLESKLRENEREMRMPLKYLPIAFGLFESVFDPKGGLIDSRFAFINDAFERILSLRNDEVKGKSLSDIWPTTGEGWTQVLGEVAVSGVPSRIKMEHAATGKIFGCSVYRPGDSQNHICMILEELNASGS